MPTRTRSLVMSRLVFITLLATTFCILLLFVNRTHAAETVNAPDAPGRISGRVTDDQGQPLGGVKVSLWGYPPPIHTPPATSPSPAVNLSPPI